MTPERWQQIEALLDAALDLPPEARAAFLEERCAGDAALRGEVERILTAGERPTPLPDSPASLAGRLLAGLELFPGGGAEPARERIGPYRLVRELGQGGMGTVYLAERDDGEFRQTVAIKLLRHGLESEELQRRFRHERQILAALEHPSIARLLDGGVSQGAPYIVMEYVDGVPLDRFCEEHRLGLPERLRLFGEVCAAVHHAHQNLIVHRDLKPSNILVSAQGQVKLLDFGIAKLLADTEPGETPMTRTGMRVMTPEYAAPEQVRAGPVTTATDVYALGVILYQLLVGQRPYELAGRSPSEIERVICETEPPRPSTVVRRQRQPRGGSAEDRGGATPMRGWRGGRAPLRRLTGDLDAIVMKALRKEPERRYPSAGELREDLIHYLEGLPVAAHSGAFTYRATKLVRRSRARIAGATAVLLLAVGLSGLHTLRLNRALSVLPGEDERVVLGEFSGVAGDSLLADAVTEALRIDLSQSTAFRVLEPLQVGAVLQRMGRPPAVRLEPALAREVALREGIPAVIVGDVARAGTGYLLTARILEVESGDVLAVARETARDSTTVIRAIDRLSKGLRGRLGESMRRVRSTPPLQRATTNSLEALQLFTQAVRAILREGDFPRAIPLLEQAIALDENFATAHFALATALGNTNTQPARRIEALRRSFELRERLSARERHGMAAAYNRLIGDLEGAIAEFRAALDATRPGETVRPSILNNLGLIYQERREFDRAELAFRDAIALDSTGSMFRYMNLQAVLMATERLAEAERVIETMARLFPDAPVVPIARASYAGARGDLPGAEQEARRLLAAFGASAVWKIPGSRLLAHALSLQGRLEEAEAALLEAIETSEATSNVAGYYAATLDLAALDLLLRGDTARSAARVEVALRRFPLADQPTSGRPYLSLSLWYSLAGDSSGARAMLADYEATELPEIRQGARRMVALAQGALALSEGRPEEAVRLLRRADTEGSCTTCVLPLLGRALERAGNVAEARELYERHLARSDRAVPWPSAAWEAGGDALWRVHLLERLLHMDLAAGDTASAARRVERAAALWSRADPVLLLRVDEARRRLRSG